jgi:hypothetical protein
MAWYPKGTQAVPLLSQFDLAESEPEPGFLEQAARFALVALSQLTYVAKVRSSVVVTKVDSSAYQLQAADPNLFVNSQRCLISIVTE